MEPEGTPPPAAETIGRSAAKLARAARKAARDAEPHVRKAADDALRAARPAAERTKQFIEAHETELRQAATMGTRVVASRVAPPGLAPVVSAFAEGIVQGARSEPPAPAGEPEQPAAAESPAAPASEDPGPLIF
ncbi:MAG: hypothetical protein IT303_15115 [Dehalococcoidia bacterium]|nr:hypothetical protein [Dehalococcoidia bacterium]